MTHDAHYWGAYWFPTPPRPDTPPKPKDPDDDDDARKAENALAARVAGLCGPHGSPFRVRMTRAEALRAEAAIFYTRTPQPKKESANDR